jgi:hypothetical protein
LANQIFGSRCLTAALHDDAIRFVGFDLFIPKGDEGEDGIV